MRLTSTISLTNVNFFKKSNLKLPLDNRYFVLKIYISIHKHNVLERCWTLVFFYITEMLKILSGSKTRTHARTHAMPLWWNGGFAFRMWGNSIGDEGAEAFAEALRSHPSLTNLRWDNTYTIEKQWKNQSSRFQVRVYKIFKKMYYCCVYIYYWGKKSNVQLNFFFCTFLLLKILVPQLRTNTEKTSQSFNQSY